MSRPRKARLQLVPLESRETPALFYNFGTDTFNGITNEVNLSISFINNNDIAWSTSPPALPNASGTDLIASNLTISLTGTGVSSTGAPVGNNVDINLGGHSLSGNLKISLSSAPDTVRIYNGQVLGNVTITGGADNDQVILGGGNVPLQIGTNLKVNLDGGNDAIAFVGPLLNVLGNTTIQMGAGNNNYKLASPIQLGGNLLMQAGNGSDPIGQLGVAGSSIGGNATFLPGSGQNSLILPANLNISGSVSYTGGAGADIVFNDASILGNLNCKLGASADTYTYGANAFVGGSANIKGNAPVIGLGGDVYTNFATITWPNAVGGFFP